MTIKKRHTPDQIRAEIREFIEKFNQPEIHYVIAYCVGYYGAVDEEVWDVIKSLMREGVIV